MPDPDVIILLRKQKGDLLLREEKQMQAMARRWLEVEKALEAELLALASEMQAEGVVTEAMVLRSQRFTRLMWQARAEMAKYADYADGLISKTQEELAQQGLDDAVQVLKLILKDARLGTAFDVLPIDALNAMFGFAGDGSPLQVLLMRNYPQAVNGLLNALVSGLAQGKHPTDVAQLMADSFGINFQRALTIARTEQLRAYRAGTMEQYRSSGIVNGYKRLATKDSRTCIGCLFRDGEVIDSLDGEFDEHPNGRCTAVPLVIGAADLSWKTGIEWFSEQPNAVQLEMLGPQRYEAWQSGTSLQEMSKFVNDPTWGGSYVPTPISEL